MNYLINKYSNLILKKQNLFLKKRKNKELINIWKKSGNKLNKLKKS